MQTFWFWQIGALLFSLEAHCAAPIDTGAALRAPGVRLAEIFNARDAKAFDESVDFDALAHRVLEGMELPDWQARDFVRGFKNNSNLLGNSLMASLRGKPSVAYLVQSARTEQGSTQTVRLDLRDAAGELTGFEYLQFELGIDSRIQDWTSHVQGSRVSENMRRISASALDSSSWWSVLFGGKTLDKEASVTIKQFGAEVRRLDYAAAHATLAKMPQEFKQSRQWATMRAVMSMNFKDHSLYRADLQWLANHHGDDPAVQFMLLDHYMYSGQFPRLLNTIDRFEQNVVEDAATNFLRCNALEMMQRRSDAIRACRRSAELEPDNELPWPQLLALYAEQHEAGPFIAVLEEFESKFAQPMDPERIVKLEGLEWLAGTAEFKSWAKLRRSREPKP